MTQTSRTPARPTAKVAEENAPIAARVHAVLWDTLGKEDPGSVATPPGEVDEFRHDDTCGIRKKVLWRQM